jgi:integrase
MKRTIRRSEVYARSEVEAILKAPRQPRDRAFLMTTYACGLRLSEVRHLKTTDSDRACMQVRVRKGKGVKERVLPLSQRLLQELVDYWRAQRQGKSGHDIAWLFLGHQAEPISATSGQNIGVAAIKGATDELPAFNGGEPRSAGRTLFKPTMAARAYAVAIR